MARVAAALALVLLIQGAFAAPQICGCGLPGSILPGPLPYFPPGSPLAVAEAEAAAFPSAPAPILAPGPYGLVSAPGPVELSGYSAYPDAAALANAELELAGLAGLAGVSPLPLPASAVSPLSITALATPSVPVSAPSVVSTSAGPASAFSTGPVCKTATFQPFPVKSSTSAIAGPVSESTAVLEGYCSTACAATRARCAGTTKNVSFKTPKIINKGSRTSSTITPAGNAVTTRSTKAGIPQVSTKVIPGPTVGPIASPLPFPGPFPAPFPGPFPFSGSYSGSSGVLVNPLASTDVLVNPLYGAVPPSVVVPEAPVTILPYPLPSAPAPVFPGPLPLPAPFPYPGPYPCAGPVPLPTPLPLPGLCPCY